MYFGTRRARCFGFVHRGSTPTGRGIVLCNALGREGLTGYRAFRSLAFRLVAAGYTVLRFDLDGTGDSDGGDWEPRRLEAWLESIDAASRLLREREGVVELHFAGLRMGATLACLHASTHPGVSGVVLWAPVVNGASYVRELRALSLLSAAARPPQRVSADWFPADSLEVAGFEVSRSTRDDLQGIDLIASLQHAPAPRVLVVHRTDATAELGLVDRLTALGVSVDESAVPGYGEFMTEDETTSALPVEALDTIVDWFTTLPARPEPLPPSPGRSNLLMSSTLLVVEPAAGRIAPEAACTPVIESPVRLPGDLFAIVSRPADQTWRRRVAILMLNTGATNRVGNGRLAVGEARYWAGLGFTVVRVDLGHTGDSAGAGPPDRFAIHAPERVREVDNVVEWLRSYDDVDRVVIYGTCSGAYQAFHAALQGTAVDLAILVNPAAWYLDSREEAGMAIYVARTSRQALLRRDEWVQLIRQPGATLQSVGKAARGFAYLAERRSRVLLSKLGMDRGDPITLGADLTRLARAGVKLMVVFAAVELGEHYLLTFAGPAVGQIERDEGLTMLRIDGGDHVFCAPGARQQMVEDVTRHLDAAFPSPRPRPEPDRPAP